MSQIPLFEAPDEYYHFGVIVHLARTGHLPDPQSIEEAIEQPSRQMAFHAPLYYLISSILVKPIDLEDFETYRRNPHAAIGEPSLHTNLNFIAHVGDPFRGTGLAVRIVRVFSSLLGAVTLIGTYLFARLAIPQRKAFALWSVLFVLFNPQFLFIHAVVSNDTLVTTLSTILLALTAYALRNPIDVRFVLISGILLALASIAKASGLLLYVPITVAILYAGYRDHGSFRRLLNYGFVLLVTFLLISAWWYWQNWRQYGDPTGSSLIAAATGLRGAAPDWVSELRGLFYSYWGLFGWFNILAPQIFYNWTIVIVGLALIGSALGFMRRWSAWPQDDRMLALIMTVFIATYTGQWVRFNNLVQAAQGRLWFPLICLIACGLTIGLDGYHLDWLKTAMIVPLALASILFPVTLIRSAYHPSDQILRTEWVPPADVIGMPLRQPWEENVCITMWVGPAKLNPEATQAFVDVAWESTCNVSGYWSVFLHLSDLSRDLCEAGNTQHIVRQYDSMPDGGNTPFPALRPGFVLQDQLTLAIPSELDWSRPWHLQIGLYDAAGSFIRAIMLPDSMTAQVHSDVVTIGRCSPELVNIRLAHPS